MYTFTSLFYHKIDTGAILCEKKFYEKKAVFKFISKKIKPFKL